MSITRINDGLAFVRGSDDYINSLPLTNGYVYFNETDNKIYMDNEIERGQYGGTVTIDKNFSTTSTNPVQNKIITNKIGTSSTSNIHPTLSGAIGNTAINNIGDGTLSGAIQSCFTSVSNGKALIASAITDKGVPTAPDASFETMANNIRNNLSTGAQIIGWGQKVPRKGTLYVGVGVHATTYPDRDNLRGYVIVSVYKNSERIFFKEQHLEWATPNVETTIIYSNVIQVNANDILTYDVSTTADEDYSNPIVRSPLNVLVFA